jgi:hypothetical protein
VEAVIEEVYKDDTMLATTARWATIRTDRNKLKKTQRKSVIKRKSKEQACDTLQKAKRDATDRSMDSLR